jgi:hypothetical protein
MGWSAPSNHLILGGLKGREYMAIRNKPCDASVFGVDIGNLTASWMASSILWRAAAAWTSW